MKKVIIVTLVYMVMFIAGLMFGSTMHAYAQCQPRMTKRIISTERVRNGFAKDFEKLGKRGFRISVTDNNGIVEIQFHGYKDSKIKSDFVLNCRDGSYINADGATLYIDVVKNLITIIGRSNWNASCFVTHQEPITRYFSYYRFA